MKGNVWTINGTDVEVYGGTAIVGTPQIGSRVDCEAEAREFFMPLALRITVVAPPEATPVPFEFQGVVTAIAGEWWTIENQLVRVLSDTQLINDPGVGDYVFVKALQQNTGELWATSIMARLDEVLISGTIEAFTGTSITVDGQVIAITSETHIIGTPVVGRQADVMALQLSDGSLIAQTVVVIEPPPIPTETPTIASPATATITPIDTAISEPSATPTP
jgi:hypothetical protein